MEKGRSGHRSSRVSRLDVRRDFLQGAEPLGLLSRERAWVRGGQGREALPEAPRWFPAASARVRPLICTCWRAHEGLA